MHTHEPTLGSDTGSSTGTIPPTATGHVPGARSLSAHPASTVALFTFGATPSGKDGAGSGCFHRSRVGRVLAVTPGEHSDRSAVHRSGGTVDGSGERPSPDRPYPIRESHYARDARGTGFNVKALKCLGI